MMVLMLLISMLLMSMMLLFLVDVAHVFDNDDVIYDDGAYVLC